MRDFLSYKEAKILEQKGLAKIFSTGVCWTRNVRWKESGKVTIWYFLESLGGYKLSWETNITTKEWKEGRMF